MIAARPSKLPRLATRLFTSAACLLVLAGCSTIPAGTVSEPLDFTDVRIRYEPITGIGDVPGSKLKRRDPSDIIKVGDTYYVFYTIVRDFPNVRAHYPDAFEWGTVFYASSKDGWHWTELGEVIPLGEKGKFDDQATFTPNIIQSPADGKFYLYYTGVQDGDPNNDNWSVWDTPSHIGVAVSEGVNPDGTFKPFVRANNGDPVVLAEPDAKSVLDGWHVDDAVLFYRPDNGLVDGEGNALGDYWLYHKGWSPVRDGVNQRIGTALEDIKGNSTPMMLATSNDPTGVFTKVRGMGPDGANYIIGSGHELLLGRNDGGYAAVVTGHFNPNINNGKYKVHTSDDGVTFKVASPSNVPGVGALRAPGLFRPDLTNHDAENVQLGWGLSQTGYGGDQGLHRFTIVSGFPGLKPNGGFMVNVDFQSGGDAATFSQSHNGQVVHWNAFAVPAFRNTVDKPAIDLKDVAGKPTAARLEILTDKISSWNGSAGSTNSGALYLDYLILADPQNVTPKAIDWRITGLKANASYELVMISAATRGLSFAADTDGDSDLADEKTGSIGSGSEYVLKVKTNADGTLIGQTKASEKEANWAGLQLREVK